ncbi:HlyD family secretion protein [Colwellia sp. D2M02]|uniref:HlyD family secretion protein n=1 Tax=Colwellia sp. D2M02 TaxID=2841562 RepID=UPI001C0A2C78|nr:HlyD family secretion protein [Colwellia sp. D2M02]MBU2891715.1 HlyD family secretion protein [Colwellia sp. D2M02]
MSDTNTNTNDTVASQKTTENINPKKADFTQKFTKIILILSLLYFVWYIVSDRFVPHTSEARIRSFVIPIVPEVAGRISKIYIAGDRPVTQGELLFEIEDQDYIFAVEQAQGNLELAGQDVGANTAAVAAAKANLEKAKADLIAKEANANRIFEVEAKGVVSKAQGDQARGVLAAAQQSVLNTQASYEQAQEQLGQQGQKNAKIQNALAALSQSKLDLARTKVRAPSDGVISYAKINVGHYAAVGSKVMTFIDSDYFWIEASYRENNLGHITKGDAVDIVLDSSPGDIFTGEVVSVGYGVSFDKSVPGELPTPQKSTGWMRSAQRFTVIIKFDANTVDKNLLREGGQADVMTYTGDNFILNGLAKVSIWITSKLAYLY